MSSDPQVAVRSEFFDHLLDFTVIGGVHVEQSLSAVELSGVFLKGLKRLINFDTTFGYNLMVFNILPCVEVENGSLQIVDILLEVLLGDFHLLQKHCLLFLKIFVTLFNQIQQFLWFAKNNPFFVHFVF